MRNMVRVIFVLLLVLFVVQPFAVVFAANGDENPWEEMNPIVQLINKVVGFLSFIAGSIFTIVFIIYGFKLAGSAGNPTARANAITGLWWTGLGALVSFGSKFIVSLLTGVSKGVG